jgi:hypothetical protein
LLLYAYEQFAARPTLDIDFMGKRISNDKESVKAAFREICEYQWVSSKEFYADKNMETHWRSFLNKLRYQETLPFETVVQEITDWLRPYWEALKS